MGRCLKYRPRLPEKRRVTLDLTQEIGPPEAKSGWRPCQSLLSKFIMSGNNILIKSSI